MLFNFCIIISVGLLVASPVDKIKKQSYNPFTRPLPHDKVESTTSNRPLPHDKVESTTSNLPDKQTDESDLENGSSLEEKKPSKLSPEKESLKLPTDTIQTSSKKKSQSTENLNLPSSKKTSPIIENKIKGTYLILAPKVIRPGRPYFITFSVKNVGESMLVTIVIQRDGNNTLRNEVKVKEGKPVKVKFQIPEDFRQGDYKLIAFGQDENQKYIVLNETDLEYQSKIASVFIQTDKPAYKMGQLLRMRVIITDPDLRPYTGPVNIYLNCPMNFRYAQWEHVTDTSGVISIEYQLPTEDIIIGTNQITVEIQDEIIKEPLLVVEDEGVLPKFEVLVESPNYVLNDESATIHVTITAMYPFNKPVNGSLELILQDDNENYPSQVKQIGDVVNGKAAIEIPIKVIQFNKFTEEKDFIIIANVTDQFSGTYHTGSKQITMFRDKYRVAVVPSSASFKPGLNFQAYVKLEFFDGGFLPEEDVKINISYGHQGYEDKSWTKGIYPVPMIGLVELNILPNEETSMIYIKADYQGFKAEVKITNKVASASEKFIHLTSESPQYNTGDKAIFTLNSTDPLPNVNLAVFARNNIISTGSINMKNGNSTKVSLTITEAMIPAALIVVYYLTDEGQVVADALNLTIGAPFANNVNISFYNEDGSAIDSENDTLLPGSQVLISGMTAPNSQVYINVMDESAYLLKPNDLLSVKGLYGELSKYQEFKKEFINRRFGPRSETIPLDACKLLKESGFAVLTNGCEIQEGTLGSGDNTVTKAGVKASPFSTTEVKRDISSRNPTKSKIKVRRNFPETWLWFDTKSSSDGKFENISIIPETMTTWIASAFSMDSVSGLGLIDNPAKVRVSRPFFVILNIPYSSQRNKNLIVDAEVFLTATEPVEVTVKLDKSEFYEIPQTTEVETYSQKIYLEPGAYGKVSFNIIPLVTGIIPIRVSASSSAGRDAEERKIVIYPEGITQQINETTYMTFGKKIKIARKFKVKIDKENVIPDSDKAIVLIQGNGFGLPMKNVQQGFSTNTDKIVTFAQNLAVAHYLDITSQFKSNSVVTNYEDLVKKDSDEMLKLQKNDGSFAAPSTITGNPVVTAFAIRYLNTIQNYITIDDEVIKTAEKWLEGKQSNDGSFGIESIYGIGNDLMDITSDDFHITLDILVNLLDAQYVPERQEIIAATSYLEKFVNQSENVETLVKLAYALTLVKSPAADVVFENLRSKYNVDAPEVNKDSNVNIIVLSYLVPILINRGEIGKAQLFSQSISASLKITSLSNWETVRALNAMSLLAEYAYHPETEAQLEIRGGEQFSHRLIIDNDNVNLLQKVEVPHISNLDDIRIIAEGAGSFFVSILWKFNIPEPMNISIPDAIYNLDVKSSFQKNFLVLSICSSSSSHSAMNVLNVEFPPGYEAYEVEHLVDNKRVYATETHDHNVFIFLQTLKSGEPICIDVKSVNQNGHTSFHDIPITLFNYNNPQHTMVTKKYSSPIKKSKRS